MEGEYLTVSDGSQIYYKLIGSGTPIVLLHGNGGSSQYFKYQIRTLSRKHQLILMDSRSHGKSTNNKNNLTFEMMANDLKELLDHLGISKVTLLGFSDGANLALIFNKYFSQYVNGLILNACNLTFEGLTYWSRVGVYLQYFLLTLLSSVSSLAKRYQMITSLMLDDLGITYEELELIECPVLMIVGEFDVIKIKHALEITKRIKRCQLKIIQGQGHLFAQVLPDKFNRIVEGFLYSTIKGELDDAKNEK